MVGFVIVCIIIIFLFSRLYFSNYYNPAALFSMIWSAILILYGLHLYDLYYANCIVLLYILIGVAMFTIGCLFPSKYTLVIGKAKPTIYKSYRVNDRFLTLLSVFAMAVLLYGSYLNINSILHGGLSALTIRYGENSTLNDSPIYVILRDFYAVPMVYVNICYSFSKAICGNKFGKEIIRAIILTILDFIALFEQACVYAFIVAIVFAICMYIKNNNISLNCYKFGKYIKWAIVAGVLLVLIMSYVRESSILKSIYEYTTGSIICFSKKLEELLSLSDDSVYKARTYGFASLLGMVRPIYNVVERLGVSWDIFENASIFYWPYLGVPVSISPHTNNYNSFVTVFFYLYKDFGLFGVICGSLLYGVICQSIYKRYQMQLNEYSLMIYIFIVISIFLTFMQSPFVSHKFAIALYLFLIVRRRSNDFSGYSDI